MGRGKGGGFAQRLFKGMVIRPHICADSLGSKVEYLSRLGLYKAVFIRLFEYSLLIGDRAQRYTYLEVLVVLASPMTRWTNVGRSTHTK